MRSMPYFLRPLCICTLVLVMLRTTVSGQHAHDHASIDSRTLLTASKSHDHDHGDHDHLLKYYDKQIYFTQNAGQFSKAVLYRADFPLGQALVTKDGMVVTAYDPDMVAARQEEGHKLEEDIKNGLPWRKLNTRMKGHTWRMNFIGASPAMHIESKHPHADKFNYFSGGNGVTNVTSYGEVWYNNVYNNVDVRYYPSAEGMLEYDIVCKPGFDQKQIAIRFDGIARMHVNGDGHLVLNTSLGDMDFPAPVVYQMINGKEQSVEAKYIVDGNTLRFELGKFDVTKALVIDPIALRWATWVNTASTGDNHGHCIWVDPTDGAIYMVARVVGTTDQITPGAFDVSANGDLEMIVGKYLEPAAVGGSGTRVWQTYIGGNGDDNPYAMEQGPDGNLYITGYTSSTNYPLTHPGSIFGGSTINNSAQSTDNIFITKINKAGTSIKSSVIGGNGDDGSFDLRINAAGDIVICGNTQSTNLATLFPGSGASNTNNGNVDVIVFKINSDLSSILWMKNYGGSSADQATIMLQNLATGDIFIGGYTSSSNFPTVNPRTGQSTLGGTTSGFLQKLKSNGNVAWSSYFQSASSRSTQILCMEFNTLQNELYFGGVTTGLATSNISASGVFDNSYNNNTDFFVCRMDTHQTFVASTYIGGGNTEVNMMGLNTDQNNDVYVFGYTNSTNFPVSALPNTPLQNTNLGNNDKVFFKLHSSLASLIFSTYYGGSGDDYDPVGERGIKFSNCRIYTIVTSKSNNVPLTLGALNTSRSGTSVYEPGLVVWANPPDLGNNTINDNQVICAGETPNSIIGSVPSYILPTIVRNGAQSNHPSFGSAATYQWQTSLDSINWTNINGATNQNLTSAEIGPLFVNTYYRRIIGGDACILAGAADQVVIVEIISVSASAHENVSCTGANDGSITAYSDGVAPFEFIWSTGATTPSISNLSPGTYSVTLTDAKGCTATNTFEITEPQSLPSVSVTPTNPTCPGGGSNGSACANPAGGTPPFTFLWSNGGTNQCINNLPAGQYFVTATDFNGCTATGSTTLTLPGAPTPVITGDLDFCDGSTTVLDAGAGYSVYAWSNGASSQTIVVSNAAAYSVTVTDANGCTGSTSVSTTVFTNPSPSIAGDLDFCAGGSTVLSAGDGYAQYAWSNGETTEAILVNTQGSFSVTVTDGNGCTGTGEASTTVFTNPAPAITGVLEFCDGDVTTLDAGAGFVSYVWTNGETTQTIEVSSADSYGVLVTDANGCTGSDDATVMVYDNPSPSIAGDLNFCDGASTTLDAGDGYAAYAWSNGSTEQTITVSTAETFTVTVTDDNGCTGTAEATTDVYSNPTPDIAGDLDFCDGSSSILDAGAGYESYQWSNGSSEQTIEVTNADAYSVTVTDANGCTGTASVSTTVFTNPSPAISGDLEFCAGGSTVLDAGNNYAQYAWSNGETTQTISVNEEGTYAVVVTDANGCTGFAEATVTVFELTVCSIGGPEEICSGTATDYCAENGIFHLWSNGSTDECIHISTPATYSVTIWDDNGCSSTCSKTLTVNDLPAATITGTDTICDGQSSQFCAATASTYSWSSGASSQCITVSEAGTYSVTTTNDQGCTSIGSRVLVVNDLPLCNLTGNEMVCAGGSSEFCAPEGYASYVWSNGQSSRCIVVSESGTYTVTVTNAAGCSATCERTLTVSSQVEAAITNDCMPFACGGTATAAGNGGTAPYTYWWSNGDAGASADSLCNTVYTVTVYDANQCSATGTVEINCAPPPCEFPITIGVDAGCGDAFATLTVNGIPVGSIAAYEWYEQSAPNVTLGDSPSFIVSSEGNYCVRVIATSPANGFYCVGNACSTVAFRSLPQCGITGDESVCSGGSVQFCATGGVSYLWSNGSSSDCITVSESGTYIVTVTGENGCTSTCSRTLAVNQNPSCTITGAQSACTGGSSVFCASTGASYVWSNGQTTQCISVSETGTYSVTVTQQSGCTSVCSRSFEINAVPTCNITGPETICSGSSAQFCATPGMASYLWSNGATGSCITVSQPGAYSVTITNANGCTASCSRTLGVSQNASCTITGPSVICNNSTAQLCVSSGQSYAWNTGATTQCITINCAGTYSVTVTNASGCTSVCSKTVTVSNIWAYTTTGLTCQGMCNGTSCVFPTGGTAPYTYQWSNGATTQSVNNLCAGIHWVTITDANGCQKVMATTVLCYPNLNLSGTVTKPTCANPCGGAISQSVSGGGGSPYAFVWNDGATTKNRTNLCAGSYTVTVTSAKGCTATKTYNLVAPAQLSVALTPVNAACFGGKGSIAATVSGSNPPYNYFWNTGATTSSIANLGAGTYSVTVTKANACSATASATIVVPAKLVATATAGACTPTGCGGSASVNAVGGTGAYSFAWSNGATTSNASGLCNGTHYVTVTDANQCTASSSVTISCSPPPCTFPIEITGNPACGASTATLGVAGIPNGATATYSWRSGSLAGPQVGTGSSFVASSAGTYCVEVTVTINGSQCIATACKTVSFKTAPTLSFNTTNASCKKGSASVIASGGVAPYTYLWSTGATTFAINNLNTGTYGVTVTAANGCTVSGSVTITTAPTLVAYTNCVHVCPGSCNGVAMVTVSGGQPPYTYQWANGGTTSSISNLCAGVYWVTVTDANNCKKILGATVMALPPVTVNGTVTNPTSCNAPCNGSIVQSITGGGSVTYWYAWSDNGPAVKNRSGLCAGSYTVTATSAHGCTGTKTYNLNCSGQASREEAQSEMPLTRATEMAVDVYPNPNVGKFTLLLNGMANGSVNVKLVDMLGRVVESRVHPVVNGSTIVEMDVDKSLASAAYLLIVTDGVSTTTKHIVVSR